MKLYPTGGGGEDIPENKDLGFWKGWYTGILLGFAIGFATMLFVIRCGMP